jgi:RimJ/RimL family protein N-acetyltransferase
MEIRKTVFNDLPDLMRIYGGAREFMRGQGNMDQWTNAYPGEDLIRSDIQNGDSYVCMDNDRLAGVFSFIMGEDPTYRKIYEGQWLNDKPYGTIHRIAVHIHNKGVASFCLDWCFTQCGNVKIDTHRDNLAMQKLVLKNGFKYCGIIYLPDGAERLAYQKTE